jgi:hypothetical protein
LAVTHFDQYRKVFDRESHTLEAAAIGFRSLVV